MKLNDYLNLEESKTFELKRDLSSAKGIVKTIVAFSNTSGGTLLIGIKDDRTVSGLNNLKEDEEQLTNLISDSISPQILPEIDILSWRDRNVLRVTVYPGPSRPYFVSSIGKDDGTYVRVGSTNRKADKGVIESLIRYSLGRSFDEEPVSEVSSEAIDFRAASELFETSRTIREKDLLTLKVFMKLSGKLIPTVGGILLFGKKRDKMFPDAWLQCGRFSGEDRSKISDSVEYRDHLPRLPYHAMDFLRKHMRTAFHIGAVEHEERRSFPLTALREAVVNAVVHADYSMRGAPVRLSIFDNRIEVENPGLLQFGLTIDELRNGVSVLRNRVIGRVFKELGLIEQWGSGIQRMISDCGSAGLPSPFFEEKGRSFRVTIFTESTGDHQLDDMNSRIVTLLLDNPAGLSTSELAGSLGITDRAVRSRMKSMVEKGLVFPVGTSPKDPRRRFVLSDSISGRS